MADAVPIEHLDFSPVLAVTGIVLFVVVLGTFLVGVHSTLERVVGRAVPGVSIRMKKVLE
jgi:hypothetical protein